MRLLVLTDFSAPADQALAYITLLSHTLPPPVQLTLLHVVRDSLLDPDYFHLSDIAPETAEAQLQERCESVQSQGVAACTTLIAHGRLLPVVRAIAEEVRADVIVASKRNTESIPDEVVDSFSLDLLRHLALPLLIVPQVYRHQVLPHRALLAIDGESVVTDVQGDVVARALLATGAADLQAVLIADGPASSEILQRANATLRASGLASQPVELEVVMADNTVEGLLQQTRDTDLLLLIARHHSGLGSLFHESYSAHIVQHTHVPLLVLHG